MNTFKRKEIFVAVLFVLSGCMLTGCIQGVVTKEQFTVSEELCAPHGGVYQVYANEEQTGGSRYVDVQCKNRVRIQTWIKR